MGTPLTPKKVAGKRVSKKAPSERPMKRIPISVAGNVARAYGYDQVIIYARRVGEAPQPFGEHMTTYGVNKTHCDVAAAIGRTLQRKMGWDTK